MTLRSETKHRILVVDDHPLVRESLATLFNHQPDMEVCGLAEDVAGALALVARVHPNVAIVDLALKASSGLDLIKELRLHHPAIHVLALSMHEERDYAERALRAGARAYIAKREATDRIVAAVRTVTRGELYASPEVFAQLAERWVGRPPLATTSPVETLSDREHEIFRLLGQGWATSRIATELGLSRKTVQSYCARIKEKLVLKNATELLRAAVQWLERGPT